MPGMSALLYTNRRGNRYYLHAGRTRTGKPRYFVAKTPGEGTLDAMPEGYEFAESINGVVSVRRIDRRGPQAPEQHVELVRAEMRRHSQLRYYRAESVRGEIVIFEPWPPLTLDTEYTGLFGIRRIESDLERRAAHTRYAPVLKFVPYGADNYSVYRMTYRGEGGWSWPLSHGPLAELAGRFVGKIGTEALFDLM
jgi:hypothetical protein